MKNQTKEREKILCKAIRQSLLELDAIGTSKYEARNAYNNEVRIKALEEGMSEEEIKHMPYLASPMIHSYSTMKQYINVCDEYALWLAGHKPDVSKLKYAYRMGYAREYVRSQIDRGLSPYTIARTTSALAKLYRCRAPDIHDNRPRRRYKDIKRSRGYNDNRYNSDLEKYGDIVFICRCTGIRRVELEHLYPECFRENASGRIYLHLDGHEQHTKGGRTRDVYILGIHQEEIRRIISTFEAGKLICPKAPSHLDIHGIRAMYASDYYHSIARPITEAMKNERIALKRPRRSSRNPNTVYTSVPGVYTRRSDRKSFDRRALLTVSRSLGHNRESVVVQNYLR